MEAMGSGGRDPERHGCRSRWEGCEGLTAPSGTTRRDKNTSRALLELQRAVTERSTRQHLAVTLCPRAGATRLPWPWGWLSLAAKEDAETCRVSWRQMGGPGNTLEMS